MKNLLFLLLSFSLVFAAFLSCSEDSPTESVPEPTAKAVYVLNSAATSISVINLETGEVFNDVATVGTWPNQLVYHKGNLYCVNSGSNNIMVFNTDTWAVDAIDLGAGNNPMNLVFYDDNTVYVACSISNKVLKVDLVSKTVTQSIDVGVGATGIAFTNGNIYVANTAFDGSTYTYGQGTVSVINGSSGAVIATINVPTNPQAVGIAPDGNVHVVSTGDYWSQFGKISIINPNTNTVANSFNIEGSPGSIAIADNDKLAYLGDWGKGCLVYNTETTTVVHDTTNYFLGKGGSGVTTDPDGNVFVSVWADDQVIKVDKDNNVVATYNVGDSPSALATKIE